MGEEGEPKTEETENLVAILPEQLGMRSFRAFESGKPDVTPPAEAAQAFVTGLIILPAENGQTNNQRFDVSVVGVDLLFSAKAKSFVEEKITDSWLIVELIHRHIEFNETKFFSLNELRPLSRPAFVFAYKKEDAQKIQAAIKPPPTTP